MSCIIILSGVPMKYPFTIILSCKGHVKDKGVDKHKGQIWELIIQIYGLNKG